MESTNRAVVKTLYFSKIQMFLRQLFNVFSISARLPILLRLDLVFVPEWKKVLQKTHTKIRKITITCITQDPKKRLSLIQDKLLPNHNFLFLRHNMFKVISLHS